MGASLRMFVVVNVLQVFVFDSWGIPFWLNVGMFILLIILYTLKGGIKTIVWTDMLQTTCMILAVILSIGFISKEIHMGIGSLLSDIWHSDNSRIFIMDWHSKRFFVKQFLSGIFIAIVMTGLDQEMMQKNLSCRNLRESQTNMLSFSWSLVFANLMFLILGASLLIYAKRNGIHVSSTDNLFPTIALKYLSPLAGLVFLVGLISAAYPSADGALTSLTTSFCIDILNFNKMNTLSDKQKQRLRYGVHIAVALILLVIIILFRSINDKAIIDKLFTIAGYTYGPLLGFFSFGLFTKWQVKDAWIPVVAVVSPVMCYYLSTHSQIWFHGYTFGFELLICNGLFTFAGMFFLRKK
jgi:Na+/proline symporter